MYTWMPLTSPDDLAKLDQHVDPEYAPKFVAMKLADGLSDAVKGILIERNYIDKDYRSTFYNFYSKQGLRYRPDCIRLHLFDETVTFDEKSLKLRARDDPRLTDHYFGYIVLRPTRIATIGRSVLLPGIRRGSNRFIIKADHKVHVLGDTLIVSGFPSMDQHRDISVCAHAACWSILRHYSERYRTYREFLTHDITMMAQQFDPGGLIPSKGLALSHAERVFQEAGTFPVRVARGTTNAEQLSFYRQLIAYVDSGFPLFAAMQRRVPGHAVAVVGYGLRSPVKTPVIGIQYSWGEIESLAVVDDNHLPYLSIPINGTTGPYSAEDIDAFIVALPEKIFYPAEAVEKLVPMLFKLGTHLPPENESIVRYFITTGSAFRRFVRRSESEFDAELLKRIMTLPFAQFIWVVEFSTRSQWDTSRVSARAVIDATASLVEPWPLWLLHSRKEVLAFSRDSVSPDLKTGISVFATSDMGQETFTRFDENFR